jgi:hypothetical protein
VALPTSAGKTRIAEIAALMTLSTKKRVLIVTPLRALSAPTERSFRRAFAPLGFTVSSLYGASGNSAGDEDALRSNNIVIATPEKLDFALRNDSSLIDDVGPIMPPMVKRRRYQRGWVETEGAKGRKQYVGRWRADDGSKPKIVVGYVSEMSLSEARTRIEAHVRGLGSRPTSADHVTFRDYWTLSFKPRRRVRWSEPTEAGYDQYMNAYLLPTFGDVRIRDIEAQHVAALFDKLRRDHTRSVVQKVWTLLRAILEDAVDDDIVGKNPMRRVPMPKTKLPKKPVLETKLVPKILKAVEGEPRNSAILHIGIFCAMRPSEVFGLRWNSFFGDHFVIRDSAW